MDYTEKVEQGLNTDAHPQERRHGSYGLTDRELTPREPYLTGPKPDPRNSI